MKTTMFGRGRIAVGAMGVLAFAGLLSPEGQAVSQERSSAQMVADAAMMAEEGPDAITFAKHVAPILQRKCQVCHQPDSIAPMSLMTYDEVRTYAAMIKDRVERRQMPPWHINRSVGIKKFKNDRGLTADEIETIGAWVDAGAPFGAAADMPPPAEFPDPGAWQLVDDFGEPDLIIPSESYTLEAVTQDKWFRPLTSTGLTEARWVKAIEIRPVGKDARTIIHHVLAFLEQEEEEGEMSAGAVVTSTRGAMGGPGLFMEWAVGKAGEIFPEGAGKVMLPDSKIRWELHMHAIGKLVEDVQVELGVWFHDKANEPRNRTRLNFLDARGRTGIDIPPGKIAVTQQHHVMQWPSRLENFQPHMHMRGKAMQMSAIYPNGREEILSLVDNFNWNWHINYIYADEVAPLLPAGTTIVITAWHDNTADNPNNPDPEQWIGWGDRTVDEMAHAWVDVTYLQQEEYDEIVDRRRAAAEAMEPE